MEKSYILNDEKYSFKPLEIFKPDSDYKVDEKELEESICRNKEIIARARAGRGKKSGGYECDHPEGRVI